jgi:hypothetical protein
MSRFVRDVAVVSLEALADHSTKRGFVAKLSGGKAALNDSATAEAFGIILDGEAQGGRDSIAVFGGNVGTTRVKLGGNVAQGARLQQKNDGTLIAEGAGARVVVGKALEAGTTDELIEAVLFAPVVYAA